MASRADIKAGRAHVEFYVKNSRFIKGLRNIEDRMKATGASIMRIGGMITGAGAAITAGLGAMVGHFAKTGDDLDKMSQRTMTGVGALAELRFAAEQSGSGIDAVEAALRKTNRTLGAAKSGSTAAAEAFAGMGLSVQRLSAMTPDQRLEAIADAMANAADQAIFAEHAAKVMGRGWEELRPMLAGGGVGIRERREEARELGLSPSPESTKAAADITDAVNRIREMIGATIYEIGFALSESVLTAMAAAQKIVKQFQDWVKANRQLVVTAAKVGIALMAIGATVMAVGGSLMLAGMAAGGLASLLTAVAGAVGLVLSPIGLVTAALVGGLVAWSRYTDAGRATVTAVRGHLGDMLGEFRKTFGAIGDAIAAGDMKLAATIAVTQLQLTFMRGVRAVADMIGGIMGPAVAKIGTQLIGGDFAGAWETALLLMAHAWDTLVEGILAGWRPAIESMGAALDGLLSRLRKARNQLADAILENAGNDNRIAGLFSSLILGRHADVFKDADKAEAGRTGTLEAAVANDERVLRALEGIKGQDIGTLEQRVVMAQERFESSKASGDKPEIERARFGVVAAEAMLQRGHDLDRNAAVIALDTEIDTLRDSLAEAMSRASTETVTENGRTTTRTLENTEVREIRQTIETFESRREAVKEEGVGAVADRQREAIAINREALGLPAQNAREEARAGARSEPSMAPALSAIQSVADRLKSLGDARAAREASGEALDDATAGGMDKASEEIDRLERQLVDMMQAAADAAKAAREEAIKPPPPPEEIIAPGIAESREQTFVAAGSMAAAAQAGGLGQGSKIEGLTRRTVGLLAKIDKTEQDAARNMQKLINLLSFS